MIDPRIHHQGDRCLIIELGDRIEPGINQRARALADYFVANPLPGVIDVVPAFTTVALHYRPEDLVNPDTRDLPYQRLAGIVSRIIDRVPVPKLAKPRTVEIPVCYGGEHGPDLEGIASACQMSTDEVIALHSRGRHFVYMIGFAPGHPYIGGLDSRLQMPRRDTPRVRVPVGSVAIAREMTAIYPHDSPGGWNVIGRTPVRLFLPESDPPCLLRAGDLVRFVPIPEERFRAMLEAPGHG